MDFTADNTQDDLQLLVLDLEGTGILYPDSNDYLHHNALPSEAWCEPVTWPLEISLPRNFIYDFNNVGRIRLARMDALVM